MESQKIFLTRYSAAPNRINLGTYGSYGNEVLKFTFGDGWEGASAVAVFNSNLENPTPVLVGADGICKVPPEATQAPTNDGKITIEGYKDSARIISLDISFTVSNRSKSLTDVAPDPSEDIIEQILLASQNAVNVANEAKEIASKSYEDSKVNADAAAESAEDAKQSAKTAKENADIAVAAKGEVDSAKQQALTEISDSKTTALKAIGDAETGAVNAVTELQTAAIAQIEASKQDALSGISTSKDSALDTIQSTQTTAVEQISSLSQTAKTEISDLKTQYLNEIQNKTAESVQSLTDAQENAIQAVEGARSAGVKAVQGAQGDAETAISKAKTGALENIATEKETSVKAINDAGSAATGAIADAKSDALSEIETAKTGAVEAVTAEGDKQAERVQAIFPAVTVDDDGKVPIVQNGAWTLGEVAQDAYTRAESDARYAPIESAIRPTVSGNPAVCEDSIAWAFQGLKVYGKSVQAGTPSPESPVPITNAGASGSIETTITGKNLLTGRLYYGRYNLDTAWIQNENAVSLPHTPDVETEGVCYAVSVKKGVTYTFSVTNPNTNAKLLLALYRTFEDTSNYKNAISNVDGAPTVSITPSEDGILVCLIAGIWTDGSTTIHECTASELLQLEVGSAATAYEAPHAQSIVATTPNGLLGLPVESGGNYTDASGQQLVCDVVDLEAKTLTQYSCAETVVLSYQNTGTYDRYIGNLSNNANASLAPFSLSNILQYNRSAGAQDGNAGFRITGNLIIAKYGNTVLDSIQVIYPLATPITTPLSDEEVAAYRALNTYPGTTVVSTAEPVAGIEARYVVNSDAWVKNEIKAAVSEAITAAVKLSGGNT